MISNKKYFKWASLCGRYTVYLSEKCYLKILVISKQFLPNEIGSSIIGHYSYYGFEAYIEDLSPLSIDSISNRFLFLRGVKGLKEFYEELNKKHLQKKYYIGEWHSHPDGAPTPSSTDDINQLAISNDRKTKCPESILVIIGDNIKKDPSYNIFVYSKKRGKIQLFQVFD